jgi:hypothetical protein
MANSVAPWSLPFREWVKYLLKMELIFIVSGVNLPDRRYQYDGAPTIRGLSQHLTNQRKHGRWCYAINDASGCPIHGI